MEIVKRARTFRLHFRPTGRPSPAQVPTVDARAPDGGGGGGRLRVVPRRRPPIDGARWAARARWLLEASALATRNARGVSSCRLLVVCIVSRAYTRAYSRDYCRFLFSSKLTDAAFAQVS